MKLSTLILIIGLMQVSAKGVGQISLNENSAPITQVLQSIKTQSGYYFIYDENQLKDQRVSLRVSNASLENVLALCFKNTPFTYRVLEKNVVISEKTNTPVISAPVNAPDTVGVHLRVKDNEGEPLPGATVTLVYKQASHTFVTNTKGELDITGVIRGTTMHISFIGYLAKDVKVTSKVIEVVLPLSNSQLDETKVIGYGMESRRFSTGSASSISAKEIAEQPVTNFVQALEGRIPGLAVTASNGVPGTQTTMQIRGQNSLKTSSSGPSTIRPYDQPLIIIDGVPFAAQNNLINQITSSLAVQGTNLTNQTPGFTALNGINPQDIESISFLKDASSTSIYGTQGANGVILITTKKGKPGKTDFNINLNTSINTVTKPVDLLNTQQYVQLRKDAFAADGVVPTAANAPDLMVFDQNKYTNWYKELYVRTPVNTNLHAQVSGGSANTTYLISGGFIHTDYNFPGNYADNVYTLHSNIHNVSLNNKLVLDYTSDMSYDHNNSGYFSAARDLLLPPNLPDLLDPKGNLVWNYKGADLSQMQFESYLRKSSVMANYNYNNVLHVSYGIINGLNVSLLAGYNRNNTVENQQIPISSLPPSTYAKPTGSAYFDNGVNQVINIEPQIDYKRTIGRGSLQALIGGTYRRNENNGTTIGGTGYNSDALLGTISGASAVTNTDSYGLKKYVALFGRLDYVYDQKYIIDLSGRRDGSSNFGPGRQFGNFGAVGLGWIFSQEQFFKNILPLISYAKLSGNYGTSGSDGNPYQYQPFWAGVSGAGTFQGSTPFYPVNLYNPVFSWDTKKQLNVGIDLGFVDNRILLNVNYYRARIGDQLTTYPLPAIAGIQNVFENLDATVQNSGWEFAVTTTNVRSKSFNWTSSFNISTNQNKLLSFPNLANSAYANLYAIGMPTTIAYLYRYKDVNPTTGLFEFYTRSGGVTSTPNGNTKTGDVVPVSYNTPKFFGGFGNNFTYKQFNLAMFFQFSKQTAKNWESGVYASTSGAPGVESNLPASFLNKYWTKPGDNATFERLTQTYSSAYNAANSFANSTGAYTDDTYLRLKTLSVGYQLPAGVLKRLHMKSCQVNIQTQNLLTFTNYKEGDPEQPGLLTVVPLQRTILCGLNLTY